jgi:cysteine-rich repeat protein
VSFDTICVSTVRPITSVTTGSSKYSFLGKSFGMSSGSCSIRMDLTTVEATFWISDSSVPVKASALVWASGRVIGSVSQTQGFSLKVFDVTVPSVSFVKPHTNGPSSGGYRVTLAGDSFGMFSSSAVVRIDETACLISLWVSDTILHCRIPAGGLGNHPVRVTVNRKVSDPGTQHNSTGVYSNVTVWSYDEYTSSCGDGFADVYQLKEDCDDSNRYNDDGCDSNCKMEISPSINVITGIQTKGVLAGAIIEWAFPANYFRSDGVSPRPAQIVLEARLSRNGSLLSSAQVDSSKTRGRIFGLIGGVQHFITIVVVDFKPTTRQYFFSSGATASVLPFNGPSEPRSVRVDVLDYMLLFVSWTPPKDFGGGITMTALTNYVVHFSTNFDGVFVEQQSTVSASENGLTVELNICEVSCMVRLQVKAYNEYGSGNGSSYLDVHLPSKPKSVTKVRTDSNNSAVIFDGSKSGAIFWKIVGSHMFDGSEPLFELSEHNHFSNQASTSSESNTETKVRLPIELLPPDVFCYVFVVSCGTKCLNIRDSPFGLLKRYSMLELMHSYPNNCYARDGCEVHAYVRGYNNLKIPNLALGISGRNAENLTQSVVKTADLGSYGAIWKISALIPPLNQSFDEPLRLFLSFSPTIYIMVRLKIVAPLKAKLESLQPSVTCTTGGSSFVIFSNMFDTSAILSLTSKKMYGVSRVTLLDVRSDVGRVAAALEFQPRASGIEVFHLTSSTVDATFTVAFASVVLSEIYPSVSQHTMPVIVNFVCQSNETISNVKVEAPFVLANLTLDSLTPRYVSATASSNSSCIFSTQCILNITITLSNLKEFKFVHRVQMLRFVPVVIFTPSLWFPKMATWSNWHRRKVACEFA